MKFKSLVPMALPSSFLIVQGAYVQMAYLASHIVPHIAPSASRDVANAYAMQRTGHKPKVYATC